MTHRLLHIDSSIQTEGSISRRLTARAVDAWRAAHPDGEVTYRDLGAHPLPHLDVEGGMARVVPPDQHSPAQAASWALTEELVGEVEQADAIVLGLPLYNFGPPSTVKAWVDHLVAPGLSVDFATMTGLLGGRDLLVVVARGGGFGPGTPKAGWDHAESWLPHGLALTGLEPRIVIAELTMAPKNPALAELIPLHEESLAAAERAVDGAWTTAVV